MICSGIVVWALLSHWVYEIGLILGGFFFGTFKNHWSIGGYTTGICLFFTFVAPGSGMEMLFRILTCWWLCSLVTCVWLWLMGSLDLSCLLVVVDTMMEIVCFTVTIGTSADGVIVGGWSANGGLYWWCTTFEEPLWGPATSDGSSCLFKVGHLGHCLLLCRWGSFLYARRESLLVGVDGLGSLVSMV